MDFFRSGFNAPTDEGLPCLACGTAHMAEAFDVCQMEADNRRPPFRFNEPYEQDNAEMAMTLAEWRLANA